jgi:hypothetical protein
MKIVAETIVMIATIIAKALPTAPLPLYARSRVLAVSKASP